MPLSGVIRGQVCAAPASYGGGVSYRAACRSLICLLRVLESFFIFFCSALLRFQAARASGFVNFTLLCLA